MVDAFLLTPWPYSTVTATPEKCTLNHSVMVPWQTPVQLKAFTGRCSPLCRRLTRALPFLGVRPTPCSGWWKLMTYFGFTFLRNRMIVFVSGSDPACGPEL